MGMPVRDAEQSILVQPTLGDIEKGVRGDPEACAYAQCVKRMLKSSTVFVYHTVAYIEVLTEQGNPVLERYLIKNGTKDYLEHFDADKGVKPAGFKLRAPEFSKTLDYKAAYQKRAHKTGAYERWEEARKERKSRAANGEKVSTRKVKARQTVGSFRQGTGCVRFVGAGASRLAKRELEA